MARLSRLIDHRYYRLRKRDRDWKLLTWAIDRVRALVLRVVMVCIRARAAAQGAWNTTTKV